MYVLGNVMTGMDLYFYVNYFSLALNIMFMFHRVSCL